MRKLALDQRQAAEIFGGGVNAFSRYETGKAKPPLALISSSGSWTATPTSWKKSAPPEPPGIEPLPPKLSS